MSIRLKMYTALLSSAVLVYSPVTFSQAPIVDASDNANTGGAGLVNSASAPNENTSAAVKQSGNVQGELFYQLQLLQQEVMQLRGTVEEQAYLLKQVKEKNRERYIELDRRFGQLSTTAKPSSVASVKQVNTNRPQVPVAKIPTEKDAYDDAYALVANRRFELGLEAFKQFLLDYPDGRYAPNSYYWIGELYQVITPQNLELSRQAFTQLLDQYPDNPKAPDAMYKLGKVYFLKGNKAKSRELLEQTIAQYSKGSSSSAADKSRQFIKANF
jgi:tol-pal system protein YbgF